MDVSWTSPEIRIVVADVRDEDADGRTGFFASLIPAFVDDKAAVRCCFVDTALGVGTLLRDALA